MIRSAEFEKDVRALNVAYIVFLRTALRQHFNNACEVLRITRKRTAQKIESLDNGQLQWLGDQLITNLLRVDEAVVLEAMVDQAVDGAGFPCSAPTTSWRVDGQLGQEIDPRWKHELATLQLGALTLLRGWLAADERRAVVAFDIRNRRFIHRLLGLDIGQLMLLSSNTSHTFLTLNLTLPVQVLVDRVFDNGSSEEIRMSMMAHSACTFRSQMLETL